MLPYHGNRRSRDFMPPAGRITYRISVLVRWRSFNRRVSATSSAVKPVFVVPTPEAEPFYRDFLSSMPGVWNEIYLQRWNRSRNRGRLEAMSMQPGPIQLSLPTSVEEHSVGTVVVLRLLFTPATSRVNPPTLDVLTTSLIIHTSLGVASSRLPSWSNNACTPQQQRCLYTDKMQLSQLNVASTKWERCASPRPESGSNQSQASRFAAEIVCPVTLPTNKRFVPDFNSCLISRSYVLNLKLSWCRVERALAKPKISLCIPISMHYETTECRRWNQL